MTDVILNELKWIMDDAGFFVHRHRPLGHDSDVLEAVSLSYTLRVSLDTAHSNIIIFYGIHWNTISVSDPKMYQKAEDILRSLSN